jgi:hypothetical protein
MEDKLQFALFEHSKSENETPYLMDGEALWISGLLRIFLIGPCD